MSEPNDLLEEDQVLIADAIRELCSGFDDDYWAARDREHEFPWDFYARLAEGGWLGLAIPEEYWGGGRGITDAAVMLHEIAASGAAMNGCSAVHLTVFGLNPVVKFGSDRLKKAFLPRAAAGDLHVAFGVTEPDAGTDTGRISTRAEPDGNGGWRIHGRKIWTSKALESEVVLLIARTGDKDSGLRGLSLFLADLVLSPLLFLGSALLYFDQKARLESAHSLERRPDARLHHALDADRPGRPDPEVEPGPAARGEP